MILSFGYTTEALLAGAKTVTRRDWKPSHAAHFKPGMLVDAWNTSPRVKLRKGAPPQEVQRRRPRKVATIRIERVYHNAMFPSFDYAREGFVYMKEHGLKVGKETPDEIWERWRRDRPWFYVVHFTVVEFLEGPKA